MALRANGAGNLRLTFADLYFVRVLISRGRRDTVSRLRPRWVETRLMMVALEALVGAEPPSVLDAGWKTRTYWSVAGRRDLPSHWSTPTVWRALLRQGDIL